ncbi:MAG: hypothetical protein PHN64_00445 [Desulfovibrionaceae bacterium]|nr:hypothetical protein [Desulfovibrionaceae bacterium]
MVWQKKAWHAAKSLSASQKGLKGSLHWPFGFAPCQYEEKEAFRERQLRAEPTAESFAPLPYFSHAYSKQSKRTGQLAVARRFVHKFLL